MKLYILLFCFLFLSSDSFGYVGCCLSSTGYVYTQLTASKYKRSGTKFYVGGACRSGASMGTCTVNSPDELGDKGDYDALYCPIDNYAWILMIGSSFLGLAYIRKKLNFQLIPDVENI
ncbi:MAG: hypothetical protein H7202_04440 [Pedobacter sp.]|nr:hypothetical protein [Pedobacter sp.]